MDNKTFGIVVGATVFIAVLMFIGLYMLSSNKPQTKPFDKGYDYGYSNDATDIVPLENTSPGKPKETFYYNKTASPQIKDNTKDTVYFDADGNIYDLGASSNNNYDIIE